MNDARSDAELNRVIAEWLGWTSDDGKWWRDKDGDAFTLGRDFAGEIHDYCNDLNPLTFAVDRLTEGQLVMYGNELMKRAGSHIECLRAKCRLRAESLVAVIEFP